MHLIKEGPHMERKMFLRDGCKHPPMLMAGPVFILDGQCCFVYVEVVTTHGQMKRPFRPHLDFWECVK